METVQVKSFQEIDELIAQQLNWVKSSFYDEYSQFTPGSEWNGSAYLLKVTILFPRKVVEAGEEDVWIDDHYRYYYWQENGGVPLFSRNWEDTELLLSECNDLLIEWSRSEETVSCSIRDTNATVPICLKIGKPFCITQCMPLATTLAWLLWHGIKIKFNLI